MDLGPNFIKIGPEVPILEHNTQKLTSVCNGPVHTEIICRGFSGKIGISGPILMKFEPRSTILRWASSIMEGN